MLGRSPIAARFASNALRQAVGAGLFLFTTLLLTRSMGAAGYASYFANWNAANLVAAGVAFGLYNEIIRRLASGQSRQVVVRALWSPHLGQLISLLLISWLVARYMHFDGWLLVLFAGSVTFGNLLTAIALGCDRFEVFMTGELSQNVSLFVLTALVQPSDPHTVGLLFVLATGVKGTIYLARARTFGRSRGAAIDRKEAFAQPVMDYAKLAYTHSILAQLTFRGFYVVTGLVISPSVMQEIAVPWSFCDRALLVAQGVTQLLYPKILAKAVSLRARFIANLATTVGFAGAVAVMVLAWTVVNSHKGLAAGKPVFFALVICIAFLPHVVRLLKMNEALAEYHFRALFISHLIAGCALVAVTGLGLALHFDNGWFPVALISIVSLLALVPFYLPWLTGAETIPATGRESAET